MSDHNRPLFPRWTNTVARASAAALLIIPALAVGGLMIYVRSPAGTGQYHLVEQPIEFDHRHHAGDEQIDCRYCHTAVEESATAGMPSTSVCISCHGQIWNKSPYLAEVREAFFTDRPIPWQRVYNLPDYVYFNHAIHVNKGVGCVSCHGRVDQQAAIYQVAPLTMSWCLDCHKNPGPHLRPQSAITDMMWVRDHNDPDQSPEALVAKYDVVPRVSCDACHR